MRRRLRLARRTLASLRSEKTIVLAILIQLFVAAFSSFLVVGLVTLYDPGATEGGYTIDIGVSGNASDELLAVADQGSSRRAIAFEDRERGRTAFTQRKVDALMLANWGENDRIHVVAIAPEGDFRTTVIVVQLKEALSDLERTRRAALTSELENEPLQRPPKPDANPYFGFTYTVLVPILVFLPAFISGSIAADSLAEELERGTLELLRVTPLSVPEIIDGKVMAMVAIAPLQAALWLVLLALNGTPVVHPLVILLLVSAFATLLVVTGATLALTIGVRREAQLLYSLLALLLFGAAFLLPESPANMVAKLAIGSPTTITYVSVILLTIGGGLGYWAIRRFVANDWPS